MQNQTKWSTNRTLEHIEQARKAEKCSADAKRHT